MEEYLAMIKMFAGNFTPRFYMSCGGQLLSISSNSAMFSLLGTVYGGDGQTTFALPDLRGRVPLGVGDGHRNYVLGQTGGSETVTLMADQMPTHTHGFCASSHPGTKNTPTSASMLAAPPSIGTGPTAQPVNIYNEDNNAYVMLSHNSILPAGNFQPHENMQPYSATNFIIAVQGIYPSRD